MVYWGFDIQRFSDGYPRSLHPATSTLHVSPPLRTVSTLTTGHGVAKEFPSTPAVGRCILALDLGENLWGLTSDVITFHLWPFVFLVCIDVY